MKERRRENLHDYRYELKGGHGSYITMCESREKFLWSVCAFHIIFYCYSSQERLGVIMPTQQEAKYHTLEFCILLLSLFSCIILFCYNHVFIPCVVSSVSPLQCFSLHAYFLYFHPNAFTILPSLLLSLHCTPSVSLITVISLCFSLHPPSSPQPKTHNSIFFLSIPPTCISPLCPSPFYSILPLPFPPPIVPPSLPPCHPFFSTDRSPSI